MKIENKDPETFEICQDCKVCSKCKNGLGPKNPPGLRGHSMVMGESGMLIYGGSKWTVTDNVMQDEINANRSLFEDRCREVIDAINDVNSETQGWKQLSSFDIGTIKWFKLWQETDPNDKARLDCLNMTQNPPFPPIERDIRYSSSIYFLATDICTDDCSGNGRCSISRCTCKNGWHGNACNKKNCPNSLCFVDIDTIEVQYCSHCSQQGKCNVKTGECACQDENG